MIRPVAVVTNATKYAGPGAVTALLAAGYVVVCHDESFPDENLRKDFQTKNTGASAYPNKTSSALIAYVAKEFGRIDLLVSNDIFPLQHLPLEAGEACDMRRACEALLITPFSLLARAASEMKRYGKGYIILVTSAAPSKPEPGFSTYSSARAGASALAQAAARELAPSGITVNAIAPNFLASETYYPSELWETEFGRKKLHKLLPLGRLGKASEIGALITFLASGSADFITGEVIKLAGGWP
jgi:NAD(P)-dependent dehydrogenase (short-subunit alcohol dehydrogenase family)